VRSQRQVLRLSLLGPATVAAGDPSEPVELATQKGAALVFYLAARPEQPVTRTRLIALLWQDSDAQEGRNSLSTALSRGAACRACRLCRRVTRQCGDPIRLTWCGRTSPRFRT
jgi:DNA-binding SARP family transcriptional activator